MKNKTVGRAVDGVAARIASGDAVGARSESFYDTKHGLVMETVLALVLWWIPYLGQMIPGYVGGRRSGSMGRGIIASVSSTFIILLLAIAGAYSLSWLMSTATIVDCMASFPALQTFFDYAVGYISMFIVLTGSGFSITTAVAGNYLLMCVFAVLGGAMANQSRKELALIVDAAVSQSAPKAPRSVRAAAAGRTLNFESYSDLSAISVNSMPGADIRSAATEKAAERPVEHQRPAAVADPEIQVTTTQVSTTSSLPSTSTSSVNSVEESAVREPERIEEPEAPKKHAPMNDYEWL